ncbi:MAG: hypothetical protein ACTHN5_23770 [Phycisphaerae bacterium]
MINISQFSKRIKRRTFAAASLFFGGALMLVVDFTTKIPTAEKGEFAFLWLFLMGLGAFFYYLSMELPTREILQVAKDNNGLITLGELSTALDIKPDLALHALKHLQRLGLAEPRWEELQKNLWQFPDYTQLPIAATIELARKNGGNISLHDLVAHGYTLEVAQQTFDTLHKKGLAQNQPADHLSIPLAQK